MKKVLMKKLENWQSIFRDNNDNVVILLNDNVNYIKFIAKKKTKIKIWKLKENISFYKKETNDF